MGKSGKLRKKRRLENAVGQPSLDCLDSAGESSGGDTERHRAKTSRGASVSDPLCDAHLQNAVNCLDYFGRFIDRYQSVENKAVRTVLFPLIEEQKSKFFDPIMKTVDGDIEKTLYDDSILFDLPAAVATFRVLASDLQVFRSKDMKPIRRALYPIVVATRSAHGLKDHCVNLSGEISNALNLRQWNVVHQKLIEMKQARMVPKLGALQRWVRQCGDVLPKELAIFLLGRIIDLTSMTVLEDDLIKKLNELYVLFAGGNSGVPDQLVHMPPYIAAHWYQASTSPTISLLTSPYIISKDNFIVDSFVLGKDRRPPSDVDMNIYRVKKDTIVFDRVEHDLACTCESSGSSKAAVFGCSICHGVFKDDVEGVPGAILLSNVLSATECAQLIQCAEMLGYYDDAVEGIEALVWIADESLLRPIFNRCRHWLPQTTLNGKKVAGINPRLRFFRYGEGAVYRPHIDGSWTADGDASLAAVDSDEIHSYFTFLIYLNGGFEGGGTTFFMPPAPDSISTVSSTIIARSVQPVQGSILCFPHGVVEGSLVHEGSAVIGNGKKYVIRTDLMFS